MTNEEIYEFKQYMKNCIMTDKTDKIEFNICKDLILQSLLSKQETIVSHYAMFAAGYYLSEFQQMKEKEKEINARFN